jgi:hypothetical protein
MNEYRVTWEIDLRANSPEEAAREALQIQRDPASTATVFNVSDVRIDLTALDEERAEIINGAARAIFVQWWADQCSCGRDAETCRLEGDGDPDWPADEEHVPNDPGGVELMDVAPETSEPAMACARKLVEVVARQDRWDDVVSRPEVVDDPEGFGHYLAMQALGHGVAWSDSHEDHGFRLPAVGFYGETWECGS